MSIHHFQNQTIVFTVGEMRQKVFFKHNIHGVVTNIKSCGITTHADFLHCKVGRNLKTLGHVHLCCLFPHSSDYSACSLFQVLELHTSVSKEPTCLSIVYLVLGLLPVSWGNWGTWVGLMWKIL